MAGDDRGWNLLISGWICTLLGTALVFALPQTMGLMTGTPLLLAGMPLLLIALSRGRRTSSFEADPEWAPTAETLPNAGRVMYRVDTSLDRPIRTSILCGACAKLGWVEGPKPVRYTCAGCGTNLWNNEEEE